MKCDRCERAGVFVQVRDTILCWACLYELASNALALELASVPYSTPKADPVLAAIAKPSPWPGGTPPWLRRWE